MSKMLVGRIFLSLFLLIIFLTSCTFFKEDNNLAQQSQQSTLNSTIQQDWTFQKLVEESDCCLIVSKFKSINETNPEYSIGISRKVDGNYQILTGIIEYTQNDLDKLPANITILEGETPFLEEFESDHLIVFLKQAENYSEFYVTGNKNGVIETDFFTLKSSNENIQQELNKFFDNNYLKLKQWREENFVFSDKMIPPPYPDNSDSNVIYPHILSTNPVFKDDNITHTETTTAPPNNN